ncbi:thioredoxin domain-containing protein [Salinibacter altiplanensis]|uniref:thioredoxin domain-containing protein n=1 Tax=Salinibacter altiplanensis TaxID=1803181 RepID=UPI000C9F1AD8|nr:thioredoxin domain-containing protein [Salinibacter altiplanensis]
MPNRLADEQSPYLRQHKDNPVDWHPWGEEAFEKAREKDTPIFLSIGYSTCHWCHVMERESFEDDDVAALLNDGFVPIKVDREERPDVDSIYMDVCQMMRGQGGWPLTVLLTPDRKPFFAATYLPKEGRFQRTGLMDLLPRVNQLWNSDDREKLLDDAEQVTDRLRSIGTDQTDGGPPGPALLDEAARQLSQQFDRTHGGFGSAPKFPAPHNLLFLLRHWHRTGEQEALDMVTTTLDRMRWGGLFDQVGYGVHRYSTDQQWKLPHFEKMLYDQAMHALAYTEAHQATGTDRYKRTAREVLTYVLRDLRAPDGGFYSAEDADSLNKEGDMEEGAFYVWSIEDIREHLEPALADLVIDVYNMSSEGNYQEERSGERTGKNVLHREQPLAAAAEQRGTDEETLRDRLNRARETLLDVRDDRSRPGLDDKVLTDWNGLMTAALAKAARVFDEEAFETAAVQTGHFVLDTMHDAEGRLLHRYREGDAGIQATLDDHAFLTWGLLELYETTFDAAWLRAATEHMETALERFWDAEAGGFYMTPEDGEALIVRPKEATDGALPSGNSVQLMNLLRLARFTGRTEFEERAAALSRWAGSSARRRPAGFTALLSGLHWALGTPREVVVAGEEGAPDTDALLRVLRGHYTPTTVTLHRPPEDAEITTLAPFVEPQTPVGDQATAYVCHDFQCEAPVTDPEGLRAQLHARDDN